MRQLRSARGQIVGPTPDVGQIQTMLLRREKLRDELESLTSQGRRWAELASLQKSQRDEVADLKQRIEQSELESKIIETAMQVRQPWNERDRLKVAIKELAARTDLPDNARDRLNQLLASLEDKKNSLQQIKQQRRELREKARSLPLRKGVLSLAGRIDAATEQGPWIGSLQKQIIQLESQVQNTTEQLVEDAKRLGLSEEDQQSILNDKRLANLPDLSGQAISQLAGPAREVRIQTIQLKQAKTHGETDKRELDRLRAQIDDFLATRKHKDLPEAIHAQTELINALRKQEQVEDRLDKLVKHRKELETDALDLEAEEALPVSQSIIYGFVFITGGFLLLWGIAQFFGWMGSSTSSEQNVGLTKAFIGMLLLIGFQLWRQLDERNTLGDLNDCSSQLDALIQQIKKTELERTEMLKLLPEHSGSLEQRMREAEHELNQLEGMLPISQNYQAISQRYQSSRKQAAAAAHALQNARSNWKKTLNHLGLAESLSPKSLRIMAEGYESLLQTRKRLKTQQDELDLRRIELSSIMQRIEALNRQITAAMEANGSKKDASRDLNEVRRDKRNSSDVKSSREERLQDGFGKKDSRSENRFGETSLAAAKPTSLSASDLSSIDGPVAKLQELTVQLAQQQQYIAQRKQLKLEDEELAKKQKMVQKSIDRIIRSRQALLAELAVESPAQLDEMLDLKAKHLKLVSQVEEQELRIRAILGGTVSYEAVQKQIEGVAAATDLERKWDAVQQRIASAQERVTQLLQRQGETTQEMKSLAADRRLPEVKLELATLDKQIELSAEHWRTLAVTSSMLEQVCNIYETERQPETLREASAFLKQLTEGKYVRVWTPLGKNALQIDNDKGQSLPLEVLSRGTREAVFIALRLSLAAAYARRGATLPLVLDDVLVNFDTVRAQSAARVLRDFSALGHQSIMFTCHEHIMRMFHEIGVQVRILPHHGETGDAKIYVPETRVAFSAPVFTQPIVEAKVVEPVKETKLEEPVSIPAVAAELVPSEPEAIPLDPVLVVEAEEFAPIEKVAREVVVEVAKPERIPARKPRSQRRPRPAPPIIEREPAIDYAWYEHDDERPIEYEVLDQIDSLPILDDSFLAHLDATVPWNPDQEEMIVPSTAPWQPIRESE